MLLEKSTELISLAREKIKIEQYSKQIEGFKSRKKQIETAKNKIQTILETVSTFRQNNIAYFDVNTKIEELLKLIQTTRTSFVKNPEWILDNDNFNGRTLLSKIDRLIKEIEKKLHKNWQNYLDRQMPSVRAELLTTLSRVPDFQDTIQTIRNLKKRILENKFPQNDVDFQAIAQHISELKQAWQKLNSENVPDAVIEFLKAAADRGASLDLLTPEVREWLEEHNLSRSLKIRLN